MIDRQRLLERFLRYVQVDTTAANDVQHYPSSPGQRELGAQIVQELLDAGCSDARQDQQGIVLGTVPANREGVPVVAFNSHLDTSPETTGKGVQPQVIPNYSGGDLVLPGDASKVIRVADNPELETLIGTTLITSDGTTLLGADDKAGVAVIMELVHHLFEQPEIPRGAVRILFTCDEEIGHGVDHVDLESLRADVAYTLDGPGANEINDETFSADLATVQIRGKNIHPSIAKHRMVNAVRAASYFLDHLPRDTLSPEVTEAREGFLHPYHLKGGVEQVTLKILLRDFETSELACQAELLRTVARSTEEKFPGAVVDLSIHPQYRNMRDGLAKEPRAVRLAIVAHQRLGREPQRAMIRGGTDGSQLTEQGLPTPNLSTGQHQPHSPLEWACLDEMYQAVEVITEIVKVWSEQGTQVV